MNANAKVNSFNRHVCAEMGKDLVAALKVFAEQHGLHLNYEGGNFMSNNFIAKLKFSVPVKISTGEVISAEQANFNLFAESVGLKPEMFGKEFTFKKEMYVVTGIALGRPKFPINATKLSDGRAYKFHVEGVLKGLSPAV